MKTLTRLIPPLKKVDLLSATALAKERADGAPPQQPRVGSEVHSHQFYASKLAKLSARQYAYIQWKAMPYTPTNDMLLGNSMAEIVLGDFKQEVGGGVTWPGSPTVFYRADAIHEDEDCVWVFEHKYLFKGQPDEWKIQASASQLLYYTGLTMAMASMSSGILTYGYYTGNTGSVAISTEKPLRMCLVVTLPDRVTYWVYEPSFNQLEEAVGFYDTKAKSVLEAVCNHDWDYVNGWDAKYKHKEHLNFFPKLTINDFTEL